MLADLREIVRDLLSNRELLDQLTRRDIRIRYKQAVMGIAWAVIMPLVVVLSGWVLRIAFAELAGAPLGTPVLAAIAVKSIGWAFFIGALGFGTTSITGNLPLVTKVYFPREVLPLAAVATQIADGMIATAALALVWPFFGIGFSWSVLWIVPLLLILLFLTTAAALLFACMNVFFRDARHLVQLVMSFGIFFTPVFFEGTAFGPGRTWVVMLNPLAPVLEGLRLAAVSGHDLSQPLVAANGALAWSPWYLLLAGGVSIAALLASALIFHRAEFRFAEYV
jgi:ABC-type polysaccharide/polyol phosphate export permease